MGIYVVTGGCKGIGEATVRKLRQEGNRVIVVDIAGGDIQADLGTCEGRDKVISEIHKMCPEGIDGLVSNAGIASTKPLSKVLSVNYFGAVAVMEGLFDLLKKRAGRCVVVSSASLAYGQREGCRFYVDNLLVNCADEERIGKLVDTFEPSQVDNAIYASTKIALVRWMKRTAPGWALSGVQLNSVAPGAVDTTIMDNVEDMGADPSATFAFPIPTLYREECLMTPESVADGIVMLVSENTSGICGAVLYCDGGTAAVLHMDKYF